MADVYSAESIKTNLRTSNAIHHPAIIFLRVRPEEDLETFRHHLKVLHEDQDQLSCFSTIKHRAMLDTSNGLFSRLPLEIQARIFDNFDPYRRTEDRNALARSLRVSKSLNHIIIPRLYRHFKLGNLYSPPRLPPDEPGESEFPLERRQENGEPVRGSVPRTHLAYCQYLETGMQERAFPSRAQLREDYGVDLDQAKVQCIRFTCALEPSNDLARQELRQLTRTHDLLSAQGQRQSPLTPTGRLFPRSSRRSARRTSLPVRHSQRLSLHPPIFENRYGTAGNHLDAPF